MSDLAYFDLKAYHLTQVDGSIGSLLQVGMPAMCVSRTLIPIATGYSNNKNELISILFGLRRLHHYIFSSRVEVQTNLKPLIPSCKKSIMAASPWLQYLLFCLAKYDVKLKYLKGKDNVITDGLSKISPLEPESHRQRWLWCHSSHHIMLEILTWESQLQEIRVAMQADQILSQLKHKIFKGWANARKSIPESIHPFWNYNTWAIGRRWIDLQSSLTSDSSILDARILKRLMHWPLRGGKGPTLNLKVSVLAWHNRGCQGIYQETWHMPVNKAQPAERASRPTCYTKQSMGETWDWHLSTSQDYLLVADYFGNFPLVRLLNNQMAAQTVSILKMMFSKHGIPVWVLTDQGRQFASADF